MMGTIPRSLGTHDGTFHADEVTACALLLLHDFIDRDKIFRTREQSVLSKCEIVCDVGGIYDPPKKLFDHHQVDYQGELSSAGMVLQYLRDEKIIEDREYDFFNHSLILGVDAHDNGRVTPVKGFCVFSNVISNFTPIENDADDEELDKAFLDAVDFVHSHLERLRLRYQYHQKCRQTVAQCMEKFRDEDCLIFEKNIAWLESFFDLGGEKHKAYFVIMPCGKHWKLRGIPPSHEDRMNVRLALPKEWGGLLDADLKNVSGIEGAVFCHKGRFISVWETLEDALKALEYTLKSSI